MKHLNIKIYGNVQDVNFRWFLLKKAQELGVFGFVLNAPDGTVYVEAEGEEGALRDFVANCHKGPRFARVEKVGIEKSELKNFKDFEIRY